MRVKSEVGSPHNACISTSYAYLGSLGQCLACVGSAMRATCAYIHTYDFAAHCATVGTTPTLLGRDESARTYVCAYGLRVLHALG